MDDDVLSDVVPSNIVSRQVRSSLSFRSALVCSMNLCRRVRASTGRVNAMTNLWKSIEPPGKALSSNHEGILGSLWEGNDPYVRS